MSELSRDARRAMRAKAHRLATQVTGKVDASDYGPEETENADIKTGMRPISRRAYKKGGKVVDNKGKDAPKNAGKKPRKTHIVNFDQIADVLVNRNVKDANEDREGIKHIGGMKTGGRAKKNWGGSNGMKMGQMSGMGNRMAGHGESMFKRAFKKGGEVHSDEKEDRALVKKMVDKDALTGKTKGGRIGKNVGGLLKGLAGSGAFGLAGLGISSLLGNKGDDEESTTPKKRGGSINNGERPKGGRMAKQDGGSVDGLMCSTGGRTARKSGGRTGKTDINIIISAGPKAEPPMMPPPDMDGPVGGPPVMMQKPPMPPQMPPQAPMVPQDMPPPMPRKSGGRTNQRAGAGSGLGRLEKTEIAKRTYKP